MGLDVGVAALDVAAEKQEQHEDQAADQPSRPTAGCFLFRYHVRTDRHRWALTLKDIHEPLLAELSSPKRTDRLFAA